MRLFDTHRQYAIQNRLPVRNVGHYQAFEQQLVGLEVLSHFLDLLLIQFLNVADILVFDFSRSVHNQKLANIAGVHLPRLQETGRPDPQNGYPDDHH